MIQVGDQTYPFRLTLGAMLRFKRATGKEVTELNEDSVEELATLFHACLVSACAADKVPFNLTLEDFCDLLSAEDLENLYGFLTSAAESSEAPGEEKKI